MRRGRGGELGRNESGRPRNGAGSRHRVPGQVNKKSGHVLPSEIHVLQSHTENMSKHNTTPHTHPLPVAAVHLVQTVEIYITNKWQGIILLQKEQQYIHTFEMARGVVL